MTELESMSILDLERASSDALRRKDAARFVAIEEEKLRRNGAPSAEAFRAIAEKVPLSAPERGFRLRWWEILIGLAVVAYLLRQKIIAAIVGGG